MTSSVRLPVYIMAGGKSSRFGRDKARALFHGQPLIRHVAERMRPLASSLWVVADRPGKYDDLSLPTLGDRAPRLGPLGGLHTALHHLATLANLPLPLPASDLEVASLPWCLAVSCDMAGLEARWVERLWERRDEAHAAVAFGPEPWDGLFALYRLDAQKEVERRLERQQRSVWRLLEAIALPVPHPPDWQQTRSINTPEDLAQMQDVSRKPR